MKTKHFNEVMNTIRACKTPGEVFEVPKGFCAKLRAKCEKGLPKGSLKKRPTEIVKACWRFVLILQRSEGGEYLKCVDKKDFKKLRRLTLNKSDSNVDWSAVNKLLDCAQPVPVYSVCTYPDTDCVGRVEEE